MVKNEICVGVASKQNTLFNFACIAKKFLIAIIVFYPTFASLYIF